ncbi:3-methyladenine DNA glycosylase [Prauserella marina]|uniref:3-methyladenine DNA glycosylase/8-oxoguanine DNA glycosylase n=1 Tax=Prauserella marina TaxID=530584 RepID=A0A222VK70_9PSEU|nr:3-methyladenine DNA glycosylase [Prauserella marina]ASR34284.1 3-methyladenine DNA glycosylase [Prauserella marina]PWV71942.1 3-methyladenine DNA glycosylase/8-oxoguanine DNA glycosylase [Prauserella marina]SDD91506.1 3-methyladenine DNA glycosylase/8-oxoguanine DNA glycosylase [Prauserella marina]
MPEYFRRWVPPFELDIDQVVAPLRRGRGDPCCRYDEGGRLWLARNTGEGPGTLVLRRASDGTVEAKAWGDGGEVLLNGLPSLLGADDDPSGFSAHHEVVEWARRRSPGLRLGATLWVWDVLVPSVLEQKVTGYEARRSWRELCRWFGERAPGPAPEWLRVPPTPAAIRSIVDWKWHRAGVDLSRRTTLIAAARVAPRLERAVVLGGAEGRALLRNVRGIGVWTAAEIAQRAWGDADAVSFGDFHIPAIVGHALAGRAFDDEGLREELEPYVPQRQRAVRYLTAAGFSRPRFGPRYAPRDYRAI